MMTDWEDSLLELPTLYLGQEVGLVFHRIRTGNEPLIPILIYFGLGIVTCSDEVIIVSHLSIKRTELDESVAHHIRVRRISSLHLLHCISGNLIPVFLMTIHHFEFTTISASHGSSHLQVLLRRAVPLFLFFRTDLDIETVGMQTLLGKFPYHH